jgi:hypothetical protein
MPSDVINEHLLNQICDVGFITGDASLNFVKLFDCFQFDELTPAGDLGRLKAGF